MWPVAVSYAALGAAVLIALWIAFQVATWRSPEKILTRRHQRLRLATSIVLLLLFAVIGVGGITDFSNDLLALTVIWVACSLLLSVLVILAILDIRETFVSYAQRYLELTKGIVEEEKRKQQNN